MGIINLEIMTTFSLKAIALWKLKKNLIFFQAVKSTCLVVSRKYTSHIFKDAVYITNQNPEVKANHVFFFFFFSTKENVEVVSTRTHHWHS